MVGSNNSQDSTGSPCRARTGIVRAPHGNLQYFPYLPGSIRGPYGTRKGAPCGQVRELTQPELAKIPHGRRIWPYGARTGPARAVHGLITISKPVRGPHSYNACIKTLRAPYGEAKFVRRRTGPVDIRFLFKTAHEQPVRGPGVWCDWGISQCCFRSRLGAVRQQTITWINAD